MRLLFFLRKNKDGQKECGQRGCQDEDRQDRIPKAARSAIRMKLPHICSLVLDRMDWQCQQAILLPPAALPLPQEKPATC